MGKISWLHFSWPTLYMVITITIASTISRRLVRRNMAESLQVRGVSGLCELVDETEMSLEQF